MTTQATITHWLGLQEQAQAETALTVHTPTDLLVRERPLPIPHHPAPIIIHLPPDVTQPQTATLSNFLRIGRLHHPLCRNAFVERVRYGYAANAREQWRTCALAAAYAGAFGPESIERPDFSYSMVVWRLSQRLGFDIGQLQVVGPTGRRNNLVDEMIQLVDENLWTREGVADWVESLGC